MIKEGNDILRPYICKLFNAILFSEYYPEMWSKGYIVPIHKKGNVNDPSNYRGITISSCLGISPKFVRLLNNMYGRQKACVYSNCELGKILKGV